MTWLLTEPIKSLARSPRCRVLHDKQVGVTRGLDEFLGGIAFNYAHGDLGHRLADFLRDPVHVLPDRLPRYVQVTAVLGKLRHTQKILVAGRTGAGRTVMTVSGA